VSEIPILGVGVAMLGVNVAYHLWLMRQSRQVERDIAYASELYRTTALALREVRATEVLH
jgi:hypothetical protein